MKKRIFSSVLAIALVLSLFTSVAFAAVSTNHEVVQEMVDETNASIARDVEIAQDIADGIIYIIGDNFISRTAVAVVIDILEFETNLKAQSTIKAAAKLGIEVRCEIEVFIVGGQKAYIDPLFVISD